MCISATSLSPVSFLRPVVLLHGLHLNRRARFRRVLCRRVRRGRVHRPPYLTTRHPQRHGTTRKECQDDRLNDFVQLFVTHRFPNK